MGATIRNARVFDCFFTLATLTTLPNPTRQTSRAGHLVPVPKVPVLERVGCIPFSFFEPMCFPLLLSGHVELFTLWGLCNKMPLTLGLEFSEVYWIRLITVCADHKTWKSNAWFPFQDQIAIIEDRITVFMLSRRAYCHIFPLIENRNKLFYIYILSW